MFFDFKLGEGEEVVNVVEVADFAGDGGAESVDAVVGFARSFEDVLDVGIFFLEGFAVDIEGLFVFLVADDDDGRLSAKAFDELEPVFEAVFVFAGAAVAHEEVEAAFGEKELVGGMVD